MSVSISSLLKQFQQMIMLTISEAPKIQYVKMLADLSSEVRLLKQLSGHSSRLVHCIVRKLFDIFKSSNRKECSATRRISVRNVSLPLFEISSRSDSNRTLLCGDDGLYLLNIVKKKFMLIFYPGRNSILSSSKCVEVNQLKVIRSSIRARQGVDLFLRQSGYQLH